jgi:hypothetical protein
MARKKKSDIATDEQFVDINYFYLYEIDLSRISLDDFLDKVDSEFKLRVLLYMQPFDDYTDIIFENMLEDFVECELYEYAAILHKEIEDRKNARSFSEISN